MAKTVYDPKTKKMIPLAEAKKETQGDYERLSIDGGLFRTLKGFAQADGIDFSGESKVTVKDAQGNTKKDANGNTMYKKDKDGNIETVKVAESTAKVSNAVRRYMEIAVNEFIAARNGASETEPATEQ